MTGTGVPLLVRSGTTAQALKGMMLNALSMPSRALRPCGKQPCRNLVQRGNCADHGGEHAVKRASDRARGSSRERGYNTPEWQRLRKRKIEESPLCECDEHRGAFDAPAATDVDHVVPHAGPSDPLFWDYSNLSSKAHSCHSRKTAARDGGFGNPVRRNH